MNKKILVYNWIPFDEKEGKGGGVTVYTKNLIEYLSKDPAFEVYFLSSGRAYDSLTDDIYIEKTTNIYEGNCHSYQIVNSPVLSSGHLSFPYPEDMQQDRKLKRIVKKFLIEIEGVDIFHFQNLEGLSLSVLELKNDFPNMRFIYSMHNYYPFCPQVMLWQQNKYACVEKDCGRCCVECVPLDVFKEKVIYNQQIVFDREHGREISEEKIEQQKKLEKTYALKATNRSLSNIEINNLQDIFGNYRKNNVAYINKYIDVVLAVSKRVADISLEFGIEKEKIQVSYIGTKVAEKQTFSPANPHIEHSVFTICYMGYMRYNKGFYFLLDALEQIPTILAKQINVVLATKIENQKVKERIRRLKEKFAGFQNYSGYTHDDMKKILKGVNLGIVCPLWEDNLPQIAIEMKAQGIPVLCSNKGGAQELTKSKDFVFEAGSIDDFIVKLTNIVNHKVSLNSYYEKSMKLVTMDDHVKELKSIYSDL